MNYYIGDTHFGHTNIIHMNNRPFANVEEMNQTMIQNWNAMVNEEDDIYIIGDLFYKGGNPVPTLKQLKGKKHLIIGNHDGSLIKNPVTRKFFVEIKDILTIWDGKQMVVLFHYPIAEWNGYFRNSILLYGHIHNNTGNDTYQIMKSRKNAYNVGADILAYTPQTLDNVIKFNKEFFAKN